MKENRSKRVTFRVTEEEYKQLEDLAYGSYRLVSVYCRDCVFGKKISNEVFVCYCTREEYEQQSGLSLKM